MKITFWYAQKGYELRLGPALRTGAALYGDQVELRPLEEYRGPEGDAGMICGVVKRDVLWDHQSAGIPILYLDKGYTRSRAPVDGASLPEWWRMCWNATHPTDYLMKLNAPGDRLFKSGLEMNAINMARAGGPVVILGSSQKFHHTEQLPHPTAWAAARVLELEALGFTNIVYRPKPSWKHAEHVVGSVLVHGDKTPVSETLHGAWCSITYGSIACVDSLRAGIPCIVLGNGVAKSISSTTISDVSAPLWKTPAEIRQWAANLSYCQFTIREIENGLAHATLKEQLHHAIRTVRKVHRPLQTAS